MLKRSVHLMSLVLGINRSECVCVLTVVMPPNGALPPPVSIRSAPKWRRESSCECGSSAAEPGREAADLIIGGAWPHAMADWWKKKSSREGGVWRGRGEGKGRLKARAGKRSWEPPGLMSRVRHAASYSPETPPHTHTYIHESKQQLQTCRRSMSAVRLPPGLMSRVRHALPHTLTRKASSSYRPAGAQ